MLYAEAAAAQGREPIDEISQAIETPIEEAAEPVKARIYSILFH